VEISKNRGCVKGDGLGEPGIGVTVLRTLVSVILAVLTSFVVCVPSGVIAVAIIVVTPHIIVVVCLWHLDVPFDCVRTIWCAVVGRGDRVIVIITGTFPLRYVQEGAM
jgi:hypothetical protein